MSLHSVSVSVSSFGADAVRQQGQQAFVALVASAGAQYLELREELFTATPDLPALGAAIATQGLLCVYSSPLELWQVGSNAPAAALAHTLERAQACGARWLKVSLGHFTPNADLKALAALLAGKPLQLLVENDQTAHGGRIEPLVQFFTAARVRQVPVAMTFDIGNWQWQAQSVLGAAAQLGQHVLYVHCKGVRVSSAGKWVAVPPGLHEIDQWPRLLQSMPQARVLAIEYPLQGEDLLAVTRQEVARLARLGSHAAAVQGARA
ncbi:sugar phosphate isomerase/epimerase family protein [Pseudomonas typographi]|uniref:AP endonuclease n=1 Tax=Pseudomonas typographi TaxID=2715964 RepID=A0ABR7Z5Q4_9PSED|nr:AP endonuclease [Pseudomonas typographi]MBD1554188.1 AP endonuclease [Pseudomonas typographi]MBD1589450.1 AP endonuclease [Pseudomonas typographi]MBD1600693.1 AP endonuclease [Pseudomonas typographi]